MRHSLLLAASALLVACAGDRPAIERCVRDYQDGLITAFRTGDVVPLGRVASENEVRKVTALVDLKRAAAMVLESSLDDFAVEGLEAVGEDAARVTTREKWTYFDRALTPGQSPGPRFVARMRMQYDLGHTDGQWRVLSVRTLSNDFLEPAGFRPAAGAHGMEAQHDAH